MNIKVPHLLLSTLLAAALAACSEPSEVYYSTRYEVTSLEAVVTRVMGWAMGRWEARP